MALFRDLTRTIAEAEGLSEMFVTGIGQYLRDAGLISKLGRGKAAAQMTTVDAANLLIAVNACDLAKNAVDTVEIYRSLDLGISPINKRGDFIANYVTADGRLLGDSIEFLLEIFREGSDAQIPELTSIEIGFGRPIPAAYINISFAGPRSPSNPFSGVDRTEDQAFAHYWKFHLWSEHPGRRELRVIDSSILSKVAAALT